MRRIRKSLNFIMCLVLCMGVAACGGGSSSKTGFYLYYLGTDNISLIPSEYSMKADKEDTKAAVKELIESMQSNSPAVKGSLAPLAADGGFRSYVLEGGVLTLDFGQEYLKLDQYEEISLRAAVVKTLCQLEGVESIFFTINEAPLADENGNPVGAMKAETFADISADTVSKTNEANLTLYFATKDGTGLVKETRNLHYKSAMSPERVVLEQLLAGPSQDNHIGVVATGTKLLGVTVKEGACHVNFDVTFAKGASSIDPEVTIYAIVNSLMELPAITKVQISIESNSDVKYMEGISLNQTFTRNTKLIREE